jgi:hypothetical protein
LFKVPKIRKNKVTCQKSLITHTAFQSLTASGQFTGKGEAGFGVSGDPQHSPQRLHDPCLIIYPLSRSCRDISHRQYQP